MSYKEIPFRRTVTKTVTERRRVAIISPTMSESDMLDALVDPPDEDTLVFMELGQIPPGGSWRKNPGGAEYVTPIESFYRLTGCPDGGPKRLSFTRNTPGSFAMEARDRLVLVRLGDYLPNVGWHFEDK